MDTNDLGRVHVHPRPHLREVPQRRLARLHAVVDVKCVLVLGGRVGGGRVDHAKVDPAQPRVELWGRSQAGEGMCVCV